MKSKLKGYAPTSEMIIEDESGNAFKVYLRGYRVMLAKDAKTGRFVKLNMAQALYERWERFKSFMAIAMCILANIFAVSYLFTA